MLKISNECELLTVINAPCERIYNRLYYINQGYPEIFKATERSKLSPTTPISLIYSIMKNLVSIVLNNKNFNESIFMLCRSFFHIR